MPQNKKTGLFILPRNPLAICEESAEYGFSSAKFYGTGEDEFNILTS